MLKDKAGLVRSRSLNESWQRYPYDFPRKDAVKTANRRSTRHKI
jgi:hypothetical protein